MITSFILNFFSSSLSWVFSFLPTVTTMPSWYNPVSETFSLLSALNNFPILGTAIIIAMLMLAIVGGWQVVVFSNWLYNKIRGSG